MQNDIPADDGVEPIAIVGLAARLPGAADVDEFWRNLVDGVESTTELTREEQLARGAQPGRVPADQHHLVTAARQLLRGGQADAGARPGQHHDPTLSEIFHRSIHPGHGTRLPWRHHALWDR